jgi:hypothetical protein
MQYFQRGLLYSLVIGIPFLIITGGHFVFSLCFGGNLFHPMLVTFIWIISVTAPIIVIFVHKTSFPDQHRNLPIEVLIVACAGCLLTACWVSTLKHSLFLT